MSKIIDFYKKVKDDPKIMADIEAVKKKYANAAKLDEKITADLIEVAKKHGTTLTPEDFQMKKADLSEDDLKAAAGGGCLPQAKCQPGLGIGAEYRP
jgi:hypothetical protein